MFSKTLMTAAIAGALFAAAAPASAADLDIYDDGYSDGTAVVINVHNRGYRHCHWVDGDRVCHRRGVPYAYYNDWDDDWDYYPAYGGYGYGYGYGPGIVLGFGGRGWGYGGHGYHGGHGFGGGYGGGGHHGGHH